MSGESNSILLNENVGFDNDISLKEEGIEAASLTVEETPNDETTSESKYVRFTLFYQQLTTFISLVLI